MADARAGRDVPRRRERVGQVDAAGRHRRGRRIQRAEGGSRSFRFATRSSESGLGRALRLGRAPGRERSSFFLRAESFYNVATEIERLDERTGEILDGYGGVTAHDRSHGESFLDLLVHRFRPGGLQEGLEQLRP